MRKPTEEQLGRIGHGSASRKRKLPPTLLFSSEPFPGAWILDEVPTDLGMLLWRVSQNVEAWALTSERERDNLFGPEAAERRRSLVTDIPIPVQIRDAVDALGRLLEIPISMSAEQISFACREICEWASDATFPRTASIFAQAAAVAHPHDAMAAYGAGQFARRAGDFDKAEVWYRRAIVVGRRNEQWNAYAIAHVGLGGLYFQRGAIPSATAALQSALKAARKYRVWSVRGPAMHDLFCIAANGGDYGEADRLAAAALRAYGRKSDKLPRLAHDVAIAWMLQGHFQRALPVLDALVATTPDLTLRLPFLCSLARAAGAVGERRLFADAWQEAWAIVDRHQNTPYVADSLISLARGAATLKDRDRARVAAQYALGVALHRNESHARLAAESILESIARPEFEMDPVRSPVDVDERVADRLAAQFVKVLTASAAE